MGAESPAEASHAEDGRVRIRITGSVRDRLSGGPPEDAEVCLAHGHTGVASAEAGPSGQFELVAEGRQRGSYHLLVLADGRDAVRRRIDVDGDLDVDVGEITLVPVEWPAGVHGQLWDEGMMTAVGPGVVTLAADDGTVVGRVPVDPDGSFSIRMSCGRPLPPGAYLLDVDAPNYEPARLRILVNERTTTQLGRVHVDPISPEADRDV